MSSGASCSCVICCFGDIFANCVALFEEVDEDDFEEEVLEAGAGVKGDCCGSVGTPESSIEIPPGNPFGVGMSRGPVVPTGLPPMELRGVTTEFPSIVLL